MDKDEALLMTIPAPVKGWFTAASLSQIDPKFATVLDNIICEPAAPISRKGYATHMTGFPATVRSLMSYYGVTPAANKIYGVTNAGIYDASTAGAAGSIQIAVTNGYGRSLLFSSSGGRFLFYMNGTDTMKRYDGATWISITGVGTGAITGLVTSTIINAAVYRRRIFFLQANDLGIWYLPVDSVAGAAVQFNLGSIFALGGSVVAIATWSIDGGAGQDDLLAIATSNGEIAIYSGEDPSVLASWALQGVFNVGKPVGQNCFAKLGGDLLYLCESGLYPLSKVLVSASIDRSKAASRNIEPTITAAVTTYKANQGWGVHVFPSKSIVLINAVLDQSEQYVMHTQTLGWSRFTGLLATCWQEFDGVIYAGIGTTVCKMFNVLLDNGAGIPVILRTAYTRYNSLLPLHPLQIRPVVVSASPPNYVIGMAINYTNSYLRQSITAALPVYAIAGTAVWGVSLWNVHNVLQNQWQTVATQAGFTGSLEWSATITLAQVQIITFDFRMAVQGPVM